MKARWWIPLLLLGLLWFGWRELPQVAIKQTASPWQPAGAAASIEAPTPRAPCAQQYPQRRAWFGDIHVHTLYSMDTASRDMFGTPEDAYRFARGETIGLGPFDDEGRGERPVKLERPLDFAAVTDHAEWIGEVNACLSPRSGAWDSRSCRAFRGEIEESGLIPGRLTQVSSYGDRQADICGEGNERCRRYLRLAWERTQVATEQYYDRSGDCSFTSFHGYEYSNNVSMSKVHRNIIFRNERVPELPVSSLEEPLPEGLWDRLDRECNNTGGACEAITVPHNPNASNGRMFTVGWRDLPEEEQRLHAERRARFEPVVEMMQIKGESECKSGMWQVQGEDELCDFEKIRGTGEDSPTDCEGDYSLGAIFGFGCESRLDFVRYALIEGMVEKQRIGVNPYRFGFAGSTDNHNASPGAVVEDSYDGCCANSDNDVVARLDTEPAFAGKGAVARNPGGLMGVWSQENSRDALFDAMQRREVFATSGPRIEPRFFAGHDLPEEICEGDFVTAGYEGGVPMGGEIGPGKNGSPLFAAAAIADSEGGLLQRLQLIKVWHDEAGVFHQSVIELDGDRDNGARVDLNSCKVSGPGSRQLCGSWRDPAFDPARPAAYYVRVVENPSCRWSWRQCLSLPVAERPPACADTDIPKVIQERAWTSAIWYSP